MNHPTKLTLDELAQLRAEGVSVGEVAKRYGLNPRTVTRKAARLAARDLRVPPVAPAVPEGFEVRKLSTSVDKDGNVRGQAIQARPAGEEPEQGSIIPPGHLIKGVSTFLGDDGTIRGQWVKTGIDQDRFRAMVEAACRAAVELLKPVAEVPAPCLTITDLLTQYTMTDSHVGMLAWGRETGEPWDLEIAERVLTQTLFAMIDAAPASFVGLLNQLGDYLHFDSLKPVTPEHGHVLDADSRYQKIVEVAVRIIRRVIERMLQKHHRVIIKLMEGNHDPAGSVWLRVLLAALYADNPRVEVDQSPLPYTYHQHGKTMLCYHHGHLSKKDSLPLLFAALYPEVWGSTTKRYIHTGHLHHVEEKEHPGIKVIQHPTIAARDAYAIRGGWLSERQATSMTYHVEHGEVARGIFLPQG